ncbi:MAG: AAA family ATPase [Chlamydiales bacterium]|nr:AAA family ATPase [Chlamydiales bacterium]
MVYSTSYQSIGSSSSGGGSINSAVGVPPAADIEDANAIAIIENVHDTLTRLVDGHAIEIVRALKRIPLEDIKAAVKRNREGWTEALHNNLIAELAHIQSFLSNPPPNLVLDPPDVGRIESLRYSLQQFTADHLPNSAYEAMQTLQVYAGFIILILFISTFTDGLLSDVIADAFPNFHWLPAVVLFSLIGFMTLSYTALKVYDRFRPLPTVIRPLTNYTQQALDGRIEPLLGRDDIIERIFLCWQSTSSAVRQHPLLVGPAGVGKTVILTEVARRIALGKIPDAFKPLMKGKQVLGGSAALLVSANDNMGGTIDVFERVLRQIRPYRKNIILALDEIHSLLRGDRSAEVLKSVLDTNIGTGGVPYFMGATTDTEYQQFIASDPARARRFYVIRVDSLTKEQVILTLNEMVRRQYPDVHVTAELLNHVFEQSAALVEEFSQYKQPEVAKRVLSSAISRIKLKQQEGPVGEQLPAMFLKLEELRYKLLHDQKLENIRAIEEKEVEIRRIQGEVVTANRGLDEYRRVSEELYKAKQENVSLAAAVQLARARRGCFAGPDEAKEKMLLFSLNYRLPHLQAEQQRLAEEHNIPLLDQNLLTEIVAEIREATKKPEEAEESDGEPEE